MFTTPRMRSLFVLLALCVLAGVPAFAQMETATLSGVIQDPNGGVVPGVEVIATRIETGTAMTTKTNGAGIYFFTGLMPGHYHLMVRKPGFKEIAIKEFQLSLQDKLEQNFSLEVGSVSETVTVEARAPLLNTTDGSVGTTVDQTYVSNMPLNGRSFQDLILLTPGVVSPLNSSFAQVGTTGEFSVNGQRQDSNVSTVDGVSANVGFNTSNNGGLSTGAASGSILSSTVLGTTQALVSVDALQEFRVQSSTYSAEYGRSPGGQLAFETKSGANQWHGSAYNYLRNDVLDATNWFNNYLGVRKGALRQNDFGGTLGGPVRVPGLYNGKDRTFFFVSYEGLRLVQPQPATTNFVPDAAMIAATPAPLQQVLKAFPVANGPDVGNGVAEFISGWSNPGSLNSTSARLDHAVNDKMRVFFRFSDTPSRSVTRGTGILKTPSESIPTEFTSRTYTGGVNSSITNRLSNEFRLNYSSNDVTSSFFIDSFGNNTPVDMAQLAGVGARATQNVLYFDLVGGHLLGISQGPNSGVQRQWNLVDSAILSVGRHQFKFGVDYRRLTPVTITSTPADTYIYFNQNAVQSNQALIAAALATAPAYPLYTSFSAFAQDQWKVSQRLSLSMGLRWEVNPAPGVTQGLKPYTIQGTPSSTTTLAPQGTPLWQTTWANVAPRLGVAYILRSTQGFETVLRGGAGTFFDTGQQLGSAGFQGPGFSSTANHFGVAFPLPVAEANPPIVNPPVPPYSSNVFWFPADLQLPYTVQWNLSIEQALGNSQALTVSYVGSHAERLLAQQYISGSAVNNSNVNLFIAYKNAQTSDYDSMQIKYQRRLSRGLTALGSYTWSHCLDYGSENFFFAAQRGNCDFDVRHNFSAAFSFDLPNAGRNSLLKAVTHHWGLDDRFTARTSFPVTLAGETFVDPMTGIQSNSGLDLTGKPLYIYGSQCNALYNNGMGCPGGRAINPSGFAIPPTDPITGDATRPGTAPRNFVRGFGAWQMDVAVRRDFPVHEGLKLQFRAEAFNIFNHPNFGQIKTDYCLPSTPPAPQNGCTFGQATGTLAQGLGVLSPLYQMGGPRSMQFALKLTF